MNCDYENQMTEDAFTLKQQASVFNMIGQILDQNYEFSPGTKLEAISIIEFITKASKEEDDSLYL